MENTYEVGQLLNKVQAISESYKKTAEAMGENFNIFSILQMESDEVATHSRFIAELLNPRGRHGQKEIFLRQFIDYFEIENFDPVKATVQVEFFIGKLSGDKKSGGRIDILIKDKEGRQVIMIENKIYASDQYNQLLRYYNKFPHGRLFYLTLFGEDCKQGSITKEQYTSISYEQHIICWLEKCKEKVATIPILSESLSQYINLIKKLTNQNSNQLMSKEIINSVLQDKSSLKAFKSLFDVHKELKQHLIREVLEKLIHELEQNGFYDFRRMDFKNDIGMFLSFKNDILKKNNLSIRLHFHAHDYSNLFIGLFNNEETFLMNSKLLEDFKTEFPEARQNKWWAANASYNNYKDWYFGTLGEIYFDFEIFYNDLEKKVKFMLEILEVK